jgi:hypothetical protein
MAITANPRAVARRPIHWLAAQLEAEEALGEDRQEDQATGDNGLNEGQRDKRQGAHVQ